MYTESYYYSQRATALGVPMTLITKHGLKSHLEMNKPLWPLKHWVVLNGIGTSQSIRYHTSPRDQIGLGTLLMVIHLRWVSVLFIMYVYALSFDWINYQFSLSDWIVYFIIRSIFHVYTKALWDNMSKSQPNCMVTKLLNIVNVKQSSCPLTNERKSAMKTHRPSLRIFEMCFESDFRKLFENIYKNKLFNLHIWQHSC